jgi:hypothetical protein
MIFRWSTGSPPERLGLKERVFAGIPMVTESRTFLPPFTVRFKPYGLPLLR